MTLTEFLLARITEDERKWQATAVANYTTRDVDCDFPGDMPGVCTCHLMKRLLADCESKRRIVARVQMGQMLPPQISDHAAGAILRALALPYADHPDCRDEWKP